MLYMILHNVSAMFARAARPGDHVIEGWLGGNLPPADDLATCEHIFARHNMDDRPDGQSAPSMSVGDVVILSEGMSTATVGAMFGIALAVRRTAAFTCDTVGFVPLAREDFARLMIHEGPYRDVISDVRKVALPPHMQ